MSVLLRPDVPRALWSGLSLVTGVAVYETLRELGVEAPELYWPNDIEVGRRKICGILGEAHLRGQTGWITMGIGLNVDLRGADRDAAAAEIRKHATSLVECAAAGTTEPRTIARRILQHLTPFYQAYKSGVSLAELVGERLAHLNGPVRVRIPEPPPAPHDSARIATGGNGGAASWTGTVRGLAPQGELLVEPSGSLPRALAAFRRPDNLVALAGAEVTYESK